MHIDTARMRPPPSTPSPREAGLHCQKWVPQEGHWTARPCKGHMLPCTAPPPFLGFGGALRSSDGGSLERPFVLLISKSLLNDPDSGF